MHSPCCSDIPLQVHQLTNVCPHISLATGGHINPAVTVCMAVLGKHPWRKVAHYLAAQYLGAFVASAVVYLKSVPSPAHAFLGNSCHSLLVHAHSYVEAFKAFDEGIRVAAGSTDATGAVFATYPAEFVTITGSFVDQVIGTALLLFAVLAIGDPKGINAPSWLQPLYICFTICTLCITYGTDARDRPF